jgi:restriction system protein
MTEHAIPSYVMMMAPTLHALDGLGGTATTDDLDAAVIARMGLTPAQLAVTVAGGDKGPRSKVAHRLGLARTHLRKLGHISNAHRGVWALEPASRAILDLDRDGAAAVLRDQDLEIRKAVRAAHVGRPGAPGEPLDADLDLDPDELSEILNDSY